MFKLRITGDLGFEFWQDIPGFEGLYQVSTYGNVKSIQRYIRGKSDSLRYLPERVLVPAIGTGGYYLIGMHKDGKIKTYNIHRIVADAFIPKWKSEYTQINHKSEVRTENQVWNLEWCTAKYNSNYGSHISKIALANTNNPKRSKEVVQLTLSGDIVKKYCSASEAERFTGYPQGNISNCCRGRQKSAYGYIWKYSN